MVVGCLEASFNESTESIEQDFEDSPNEMTFDSMVGGDNPSEIDDGGTEEDDSGIAPPKPDLR